MDRKNLRKNDSWILALDLLRQPIWPLIRLVHMLSLAGGYDTPKDLINDLPSPLDTGSLVYEDPRQKLYNYLDVLEPLVLGKIPSQKILGNDSEELDPIEKSLIFCHQMVLERELETINSLLCGPCNCHLCCIGPGAHDKNFFFEIPLRQDELRLFNVDVISTQASKSMSPYDDNSLFINGVPFFELGPIIIEWKRGHSLILSRESRCQNLDASLGCKVYSTRPITCRRPQIFAYVIEEDSKSGTFQFQGKLLAILDCPYVPELRREIHQYASLNELDVILTKNRC